MHVKHLLPTGVPHVSSSLDSVEEARGYPSWLSGLFKFSPEVSSKLAPYGWPPVCHFASTASSTPANL